MSESIAQEENSREDGEKCGTQAPGCDGHGGCGGNGGCGGHSSLVPELDARLIDPVIRQSAIFGVLVGLRPAQAVTVLTDQDPTPVVEFLHERLPGEYEVAIDPVAEDAYRATFARM